MLTLKERARAGAVRASIAVRRFLDRNAFRLAAWCMLIAIAAKFVQLILVVQDEPTPAPRVLEFHLTDGTRCVITADGSALACEWLWDRPSKGKQP